jgi:hypothetical protein
MYLRELTAGLEEAVQTGAVAAVAQRLLDRFFSEHGLPMPKLTFVNRVSARWLARCKWFRGAQNTEMEIQKSALGNEKTLERVLAHELIHHWQYLRTDQYAALSMAKLGFQPDGHGPEFEQYAAKINAVMGPGYVSKTSDQSYDTSEVPQFYILVQPHTGGRFGYTVTLRPSAQQKIEIADRIAAKQARLFRITDGQFWMGAIPIKRNGGYVLPKDAESDRGKALSALYNSGQQVTL